MATVISIGFDPSAEILSGNGWILTYLDADGDTVVTPFATWVTAVAAAQDVLSDDTSIDMFFYQRAVDDLIAANAAPLATAKATKRTSEGLDATP